jgi:hypothetical protein
MRKREWKTKRLELISIPRLLRARPPAQARNLKLLKQKHHLRNFFILERRRGFHRRGPVFGCAH